MGEAEDLAGHGKPVTAESECLRIQHEAQKAVDRFNSKGMGAEALTSQGVAVGASRCARAVAALARAPSRTVDRQQIAKTIYSVWPNGSIVRVPTTDVGVRYRDELRQDTWDDAPDRHADCLRAADLILALRDSHRTGGDGWSDDMEAAPKDGSLILLYGKMRRFPHAGWYIGKWWKHPDESFWVAHSVEVAATRWAPLPPSPDAGGGMKASVE